MLLTCSLAADMEADKNTKSFNRAEGDHSPAHTSISIGKLFLHGDDSLARRRL